jgi:hypothetical protein
MDDEIARISIDQDENVAGENSDPASILYDFLSSEDNKDSNSYPKLQEIIWALTQLFDILQKFFERVVNEDNTQREVIQPLFCHPFFSQGVSSSPAYNKILTSLLSTVSSQFIADVKIIEDNSTTINN